MNENNRSRSVGAGNRRCRFNRYISSGERHRVSSDDSSRLATGRTYSMLPTISMGSAIDTAVLLRRPAESDTIRWSRVTTWGERGVEHPVNLGEVKVRS